MLFSTVVTLVSLFSQWREFQKPRLVDGVPDYTAAAMARQAEGLKDFQQRLSSLPERNADWQIVRAEMNGLEFDHRVLQPWARMPDFYVTLFTDETDQPAREGPHAFPGVMLPQATDADFARIPPLLEQARRNLTGNARDLWKYGIMDVRAQRDALRSLPSRPVVQRALQATESYLGWLEQQLPSKTGPSGVGVENYDWYLRNVQLVPYTWAQEVTLMERELSRAKASLFMEEQKNRGQPEPQPVASADEFNQRFGAAVTDYMAFLKRNDVLTVRDEMDAALRSHVGKYTPKRPLEFFTEVDYRDPVLMRTHGYHWFDLARLAHDPHPDPVRRGALLYNIFDTRTEGWATAMEELMMQRGLCDSRPRSRELIYVLVAQRAARALGDLRMHANQLTLEQAAQFASANTPRGWLRLSGQTVWFEQHLYLTQPAYGTSYLIGKLMFDEMLANWKGTLREFIDRKDAIGLIPASLVRWELTGDASAVPQ